MFQKEVLTITRWGTITTQFYDGQAWRDFSMDWAGLDETEFYHMVVHTQNGDHLFAFSTGPPKSDQNYDSSWTPVGPNYEIWKMEQTARHSGTWSRFSEIPFFVHPLLEDHSMFPNPFFKLPRFVSERVNHKFSSGFTYKYNCELIYPVVRGEFFFINSF